ncbi:MAG: hypothetical protein Q4B43_08365 [Bacteroidota bacterium]|nr:hypothetical protein [Bacteroidota bacterium]
MSTEVNTNQDATHGNENKNNNNGLKAGLVVLGLLLVGAVGYIVKLNGEVKEKTAEVTTALTEKQKVLADLEALKATYDTAIADNTALSEELKAEREKVEKLIAEVKQAKDNASSLAGFRSKYNDLKTKFDALQKENEELKLANENLSKAIDSTNVVLSEEREYTQTLLGQNEQLNKIVDEASKLTIHNLQTSAYKVKSSGKEIATEKARKADMLKIEFTIAENKVAKTGDKQYYVQVIDSKNNVLGDKQTVTFGDQTLTYSFITSVEYNNKSVKVSENLKGDNFEKGLYRVHIFDKNEMVASQNFTLK